MTGEIEARMQALWDDVARWVAENPDAPARTPCQHTWGRAYCLQCEEQVAHEADYEKRRR